MDRTIIRDVESLSEAPLTIETFNTTETVVEDEQ